jgi:hypothetical protein
MVLSVSACSVVERIDPEDMSGISAADEIDGLARELASDLGWTFINRSRHGGRLACFAFQSDITRAQKQWLG